jgi:hypothetical protein
VALARNHRAPWRSARGAGTGRHNELAAGLAYSNPGAAPGGSTPMQPVRWRRYDAAS